jgi:hypothetical protein
VMALRGETIAPSRAGGDIPACCHARADAPIRRFRVKSSS